MKSDVRLSDAIALSPLGTARARLDPAARHAPPGAEAADPDASLTQAAFLAFEVAGWATALAPAERRRFEALLLDLLSALETGSTRVRVSASAAALCAELPEIVGAPGSRCPLILEDGWLAPHRLHAAEKRLGAALATRLRGPEAAPLFSPDAIAAAVAQVAATSVPPPSDEQQAAVRTALGGRLGVITGGPGTGKTTVVLALVRTLAEVGVPPEAIALAAPTGKAANRLGEAIRSGLERVVPAATTVAAALAEPETLHRLLRHSPSARSFAHGEKTPLPFQVVIVDECSMIDLSLMDRLLAALRPGTLLVLLGDADQLPSVDAGAVFRDLAPLGVRLVQSHRMDPSRPEGQRILALATAVRAGSANLGGLLDQKPTAAALAFDGVELCPGSEREAFIARWFDEKVYAMPDLRTLSTAVHTFGRTEAGGEPGFSPAAIAAFDAAFAHHQRTRLLAVTRARAYGVDAINAWMHARWGGRVGGFAAGEPVMILRNDYDRGLWNGDQGLVINLAAEPRGSDDQIAHTGTQALAEPPRLAAIFRVDGRWTPFPLEGLRESLTLAFALTVHKAQGSEYDEVALVLPEVPHPLLTRDLLYTALTRCRRALILVGDQPVLAAGVTNAVQRASGLSAGLSTALAP